MLCGMSFLSPFLCAGLLFFWQLLFALQALALGDPAGSSTEAGPGCVDCAEGDPTSKQVADINQLINRETCRKMLKKPECVNVPDLLKADCETYSPNPLPGITDMFTCMGSFGLGATLSSLIAIIKLTHFAQTEKKFNTGTRQMRFSFWGTLLALGGGTLYISHQFEKAVKQSSRLARSNNWDHETHHQYARSRLLTSLAEKVYNLTYNDSHCYSPVARGVRVCGVVGALSGLSIAGGVTFAVLSHSVAASAIGGAAGGGGQHWEWYWVERELLWVWRECYMKPSTRGRKKSEKPFTLNFRKPVRRF